MVIWCFCTYKYKWQLSPGAHTPRPHMLLERKTAPQGAPADCLSSCHASPRGTGNGKDSDPLSCFVWETDVVKPQQFLVLRWSCTGWGAGVLCTHPPCAPLRHPCQHSWEMKQALAANRHWSCTAPERLSQHINFHTLSQDHSVCSVCSSHDSLCWEKDGSSRYSSTYSQPVENSSIAAQFSGNSWQKAGALSLQWTNSRA